MRHLPFQSSAIRCTVLIATFTLGSLDGAPAPIQWDDMVWVSLPIGDRTVRKAVLTVKADLAGTGRQALMQLDLGSNQTIVYGVPYGHLGGAPVKSDGKYASFTGRVAAFQFDGQRMVYDEKAGEPPKDGQPAELGTLGADFFENRILLLDFVRNKLAIVPGNVGSGNYDLSRIEQGVSFTPIDFRSGKIFVTMQMVGKEERGMFFDTGSSAFALVTTRARWEQLTGRSRDDRRNDVWRVKSWGNDAALIGAPMAGTLCVSKACVTSPMIFFESSGLKNLDFENYDFRASGLFGNALFVDRFSVIVDLPRGRFGLVERALSSD